jgi:hypothetical protein
MENYIFTIIRNHGAVMEECKWLNVQNVELKFRILRSRGKWQVAQTSKENECSWKSGYINAQMVTPSAKYSAKRKSKHAQPETEIN